MYSTFVFNERSDAMSEKKKSFLLYVDRKKEISMLSDEQAGKLFKAVFEYADSGTETEFEELALALMFSVFKSQIDANAEKYAEKAERNRKYYQSKKANSENSVKLSQIQKIQSNSAYDTDTDTVTDTVTGTDTVTDTEIIYTDNYNNKDIDSVASATQHTPDSEKTQKEVKHKFGEYQHVRLTDNQFQKLVEDYGESKLKLYIRKVDEYCQQHGKSYKDYNLTIRNWMNKDNVPKLNGGVQNAEFDQRFGKLA